LCYGNRLLAMIPVGKVTTVGVAPDGTSSAQP